MAAAIEVKRRSASPSFNYDSNINELEDQHEIRPPRATSNTARHRQVSHRNQTIRFPSSPLNMTASNSNRKFKQIRSHAIFKPQAKALRLAQVLVLLLVAVSCIQQPTQATPNDKQQEHQQQQNQASNSRLRRQLGLPDELATMDSAPQPNTNNHDNPNANPNNHEYSFGLSASSGPKLRIVNMFAPEAVQNATQNVTIDCMFKFDRKLDQRLAIKWFFNDEIEPIYEWIPELNKRVYSDKYEHFIDKSYEVTEDVEWMLQSYKRLVQASTASATPTQQAPQAVPASSDDSAANNLVLPTSGLGEHMLAAPSAQATPIQLESEADPRATRRLLAQRLARLAKLGGRQSGQLVDNLRQALLMADQDFARFRALRLVRPTGELGGKFTCSVSSLDDQDERSTRLVVYEPAKSFNFTVSRASERQLRLECHASGLFPRPQIGLFRYRAGPLDATSGGAGSPQSHHTQQVGRLSGARPRLAATLLRQEPLAGSHTRTQVVNSGGDGRNSVAQDDDDAIVARRNEVPASSSRGAHKAVELAGASSLGAFDVSMYASVDESSLSADVISQFECLVSVEGSPYELRQSLALQKGWNVAPAALVSKSTVVGLLSVVASLFCLGLALVSSALIVRLLKRHASRRRLVACSTTTTNSRDEPPSGPNPSSRVGQLHNSKSNPNSNSNSESDVSATASSSAGCHSPPATSANLGAPNLASAITGGASIDESVYRVPRGGPPAVAPKRLPPAIGGYQSSMANPRVPVEAPANRFTKYNSTFKGLAASSLSGSQFSPQHQQRGQDWGYSGAQGVPSLLSHQYSTQRTVSRQPQSTGSSTTGVVVGGKPLYC